MSKRDAIYTLISGLVDGEAVIWGDQNAPAPPLPYWTLRLNARRSLGMDEQGQGVDDDGDLTISGVREETLMIQRLGPMSQDLVADLRDNLGKVTVREAMQAENIVFYDFGPVGFVPFRRDNDHLEPRATLDVFMRYGVSITDRVGAIENVQIGTELATDSSAPNYDPDLAGSIDVDLTA